jgi:hypothetical protein
MLRDVTQSLAKSEGKRSPERPSLGWDDNIRMYLGEKIAKVVIWTGQMVGFYEHGGKPLSSIQAVIFFAG